MYPENFVLRSIRCSSVARNLLSNGKSSCLLCRKSSTATNERVFRMESKTEKLYHDICKGERAALGKISIIIWYFILWDSHISSITARGITLVESSHKASTAQSRLLVNRLMIHCKQKAALSGKPSLAFRIGLSGPPGAGKSTFTGDNEKVRRECHHWYLQKSSVRSWLRPGTGWRSWPWTRAAAPPEAASWATRRGCPSWPGTSGHSSGPAPAGDTWGASQGGTDTTVKHEADVLLIVKDH